MSDDDKIREPLRPLSPEEYDAAPVPTKEEIREALRRGSEDLRLAKRGRVAPRQKRVPDDGRRRIRAEVAREWADRLEALEAVEQDSAESIDTAGELYVLGGRVSMLSQIQMALLKWADDEEAGRNG